MNKIVIIILIVLGLVAFGVYRRYVPLSDGCGCNCCGQEVLVEEVVAVEEPVEEEVVIVDEVKSEAKPSDCCCSHAHADEKINNEK